MGDAAKTIADALWRVLWMLAVATVLALLVVRIAAGLIGAA